MPICRNRFSFTVSIGACFLCSLLILMLPLQWIFAAVLAALFHECCHVLAVRICGGRILAVYVGQHGARMQARSLPPAKEVICTLAGPFGSLLLLLFVRHIPRIAFCAAVHGIYNLLPLSHLDGGKALYSILKTQFPEKARAISIAIQNTFLIFLWILAVYLAVFRRLGLMPMLFVLTLTHAAKKDLANMAGSRYNNIDIDKGVRL